MFRPLRHVIFLAIGFPLAFSGLFLSAHAADMVSVETLASGGQPGVMVPTPDTVDKVDMNQLKSPAKTNASLSNQDFEKEEAQRQLQQLMNAQKALMAQIQTLQARIETNEMQTKANTEQLNTVTEDNQDQDAQLQSLFKRTKINGYVESGWRTYSHGPRTDEYQGANGRSGNSFDLRRLVIRPNIQFTDKLGWFSEVEFEDAGHDEISVEQSEFYYSYKPWLNLRTGMLVPPLTPTAYNHEGTNRLLVDRPLVDQFVVPSTYNDLGAGVNGFVPLFQRSGFNYEVMVLNGFTDMFDSNAAAGKKVSSSIDYIGLRPLRPADHGDHWLDNNSNKAVFGRLGFLPFPGLEVGVGAHVGAYDPRGDKTLSLLLGDLRYRHKRFALLGEYANAIFQRGEGISSQGVPFSLFPTSVNGYFIQPSFDITRKLAAVVGWNWVNLDASASGNKMWRLSTGLRYNPIGRVFLKAEYQMTSARAQFPDEHFSNAFLTQVTFDF